METRVTDLNNQYQIWRRALEIVTKLDKLFVVGCAKSGTTWISNLLNGHPEIVVRGEGSFALMLKEYIGRALCDFNKHQEEQDPITQFRRIDYLLFLRAISDSQMFRYAAESKRDMQRIRIIGDKTPQHSVCLPLLDEIYGDAKYIHIIRDPRDAVTSAWFHFGKSDKRPFEEYIQHFMTDVWALNVRSAREHAPKLGNRYLEIRYEDLHEHEFEVVQRMLNHLKVDASDTAVKTCMEAGRFERRSGGRHRGEADNNNFYRSGVIGDWRNHLPMALAAECCEKIAPLMRDCGYDPTCEPARA